MLKDLNMFISPNRLCVRNLPPTLTDQQLRRVFLKAVGEKKAKLTEAKVIKDMRAKGTSKGYGFVAFEQHEHALKCLR